MKPQDMESVSWITGSDLKDDAVNPIFRTSE